jgi:hypothetical protein
MDPWAEIRRKVETWYSQPAYDRYANANPGSALFGAVYGVLMLAIFTLVPIPKHYLSRHLLQEGVLAIAIVDDLKVEPYRPKYSSLRYQTDLRYHFTAQDGRRYDGASDVTLSRRVGFDKGTLIGVLYDANDPTKNGWRIEIEEINSQIASWLAAMLFVYGLLGVFVYRYVRWRMNRIQEIPA